MNSQDQETPEPQRCPTPMQGMKLETAFQPGRFEPRQTAELPKSRSQSATRKRSPDYTPVRSSILHKNLVRKVNLADSNRKMSPNAEYQKIVHQSPVRTRGTPITEPRLNTGIKKADIFVDQFKSNGSPPKRNQPQTQSTLRRQGSPPLNTYAQSSQNFGSSAKTVSGMKEVPAAGNLLQQFQNEDQRIHKLAKSYRIAEYGTTETLPKKEASAVLLSKHEIALSPKSSASTLLGTRTQALPRNQGQDEFLQTSFGVEASKEYCSTRTQVLKSRSSHRVMEEERVSKERLKRIKPVETYARKSRGSGRGGYAYSRGPAAEEAEQIYQLQFQNQQSTENENEPQWLQNVQASSNSGSRDHSQNSQHKSILKNSKTHNTNQSVNQETRSHNSRNSVHFKDDYAEGETTSNHSVPNGNANQPGKKIALLFGELQQDNMNGSMVRPDLVLTQKSYMEALSDSNKAIIIDNREPRSNQKAKPASKSQPPRWTESRIPRITPIEKPLKIEDKGLAQNVKSRVNYRLGQSIGCPTRSKSSLTAGRAASTSRSRSSRLVLSNSKSPHARRNRGNEASASHHSKLKFIKPKQNEKSLNQESPKEADDNEATKNGPAGRKGWNKKADTHPAISGKENPTITSNSKPKYRQRSISPQKQLPRQAEQKHREFASPAQEFGSSQSEDNDVEQASELSLSKIEEEERNLERRSRADETIGVIGQQQNELQTKKHWVESAAADRSSGAGRRAPPSVTLNSAIAQVSNQVKVMKHRDDALGSEDEQSQGMPKDTVRAIDSWYMNALQMMPMDNQHKLVSPQNCGAGVWSPGFFNQTGGDTGRGRETNANSLKSSPKYQEPALEDAAPNATAPLAFRQHHKTAITSYQTEGKLASQRTFMPVHSSRQSTPRSQSPSTTDAAAGHSRMPAAAPDGELLPERRKSANQKTSQNPNFVNFIEKNKQNARKHHRSKPGHDQKDENVKAGKNKTKMQMNQSSRHTSQNASNIDLLVVSRPPDALNEKVERPSSNKTYALLKLGSSSVVDQQLLEAERAARAEGGSYLSLTSMSNIDPYSCGRQTNAQSADGHEVKTAEKHQVLTSDQTKENGDSSKLANDGLLARNGEQQNQGERSVPHPQGMQPYLQAELGKGDDAISAEWRLVQKPGQSGSHVGQRNVASRSLGGLQCESAPTYQQEPTKQTVKAYIEIIDQQERVKVKENQRSGSEKSQATNASNKSNLARKMEQELKEKMTERVNRFKRLQLQTKSQQLLLTNQLCLSTKQQSSPLLPNVAALPPSQLESLGGIETFRDTEEQASQSPMVHQPHQEYAQESYRRCRQQVDDASADGSSSGRLQEMEQADIIATSKHMLNRSLPQPQHLSTSADAFQLQTGKQPQSISSKLYQQWQITNLKDQLYKTNDFNAQLTRANQKLHKESLELKKKHISQRWCSRGQTQEENSMIMDRSPSRSEKSMKSLKTHSPNHPSLSSFYKAPISSDQKMNTASFTRARDNYQNETASADHLVSHGPISHYQNISFTDNLIAENLELQENICKRHIYQKWLKQRYFDLLRLRVMQQILLKDLHCRILHKKATYTKFICFLSLKRQLVVKMHQKRLLCTMSNSLKANAFRALIQNAITEQKCHNFKKIGEIKLKSKYFIALEYAKSYGQEMRQKNKLAQDFRIFKLKQRSLFSLRQMCHSFGRTFSGQIMRNIYIPADYEIKEVLNQASQYRIRHLKYALLNQISKQVQERKQMSKIKRFYQQNVKQRILYHWKKEVNQSKVEKISKVKALRADKNFSRLVKGFSSLLFHKDEMKRLRVQKRKYTFFLKNRVWHKWNQFIIQKQEHDIKINYLQTRWNMIRRNHVLQAWKEINAGWRQLMTNFMVVSSRCQINGQFRHFKHMRELFQEQTSTRKALKFRCLHMLKRFTKNQQKLNHNRKFKLEMLSYKSHKALITKVLFAFKKRVSCNKSFQILQAQTQKLVIFKAFTKLRSKCFQLKNLSQQEKVSELNCQLVDQRGQKQQLVQLRDKNYQLEEQASAQMEMVQQLKAQIASYQTQLEQNLKQMSALNSDNLQKATDLEKCEEKFKEVQPMLLKYEHKVKQQKLEQENLIDKLYGEKKNNIKLMKQMQQMKIANQQLDVKNKKLEEEHRALKINYEHLNLAARDSEELKKMNMQSQAGELQKKNSKQLDFINELLKQNEEVRKENQSLKSQNRQMTTENETVCMKMTQKLIHDKSLNLTRNSMRQLENQVLSNMMTQDVEAMPTSARTEHINKVQKRLNPQLISQEQHNITQQPQSPIRLQDEHTQFLNSKSTHNLQLQQLDRSRSRSKSNERGNTDQQSAINDNQQYKPEPKLQSRHRSRASFLRASRQRSPSLIKSPKQEGQSQHGGHTTARSSQCCSQLPQNYNAEEVQQDQLQQPPPATMVRDFIKKDQDSLVFKEQHKDILSEIQVVPGKQSEPYKKLEGRILHIDSTDKQGSRRDELQNIEQSEEERTYAPNFALSENSAQNMQRAEHSYKRPKSQNKKPISKTDKENSVLLDQRIVNEDQNESQPVLTTQMMADKLFSMNQNTEVIGLQKNGAHNRNSHEKAAEEEGDQAKSTTQASQFRQPLLATAEPLQSAQETFQYQQVQGGVENLPVLLCSKVSRELGSSDGMQAASLQSCRIQDYSYLHSIHARPSKQKVALPFFGQDTAGGGSDPANSTMSQDKGSPKRLKKFSPRWLVASGIQEQPNEASENHESFDRQEAGTIQSQLYFRRDMHKFIKK